MQSLGIDAYIGDEMVKNKNIAKEYLFTILLAVAFAFVFRATVAQSYEIPSASMMNTLHVGDHLTVEKISKRFRSPERGEIIVFQSPVDPEITMIKRVIALPGETIEMMGNRVYIDGELLIEPYAIHEGVARISHSEPYTVPEGHLFMMGDNRNNSADSRYWGPLDMKLVDGKAIIVHWSWIEDTYGVRWSRIGKLLG